MCNLCCGAATTGQKDVYAAMRTRLLSGLAALVLGAGVLYVLMPGGEPPGSRLRPDDAATVALGGSIYARECAGCHGANGEGQQNWDTASTAEDPLAPPHDGTGHTWQHPDEALFELTKFGLSTVACRRLDPDVMPQFAQTLGDDEIVAVLSFIKSRWPEPIRLKNAEINAIYTTQQN
jgi:mono/diheme cytochrome c family protein